MFSDNLKTLRKNRGITQEELASRLKVVRQTVSKWEKGLSVPDAEMLVKISEELDVSVSELLGAKIEDEQSKSDIAEQLARINEQLAIKNRRARRVWIGLLVILIVIPMISNILLVMFSYVPDSKKENGQNIPIEHEWNTETEK